MKDLAAIALVLTPATILACGSVYLAVQGMNGWGWFLFGAIILAGSFRYSSNSSEACSNV